MGRGEDWTHSSDYENAWDAQIAGLRRSDEYRLSFKDPILEKLANRQYMKLKRVSDPEWYAMYKRKDRNRKALKSPLARTRKLARYRVKYHTDECFKERGKERSRASYERRRAMDSDWYVRKCEAFVARYHGDFDFRERVKSSNNKRNRERYRTDPAYRARKAQRQREYRKRKREEAAQNAG